MSVESFTPTALQFTQGAAHKVKSLVDEEGNDRLKLRVFVTGGGCSGFQYGFTFDEEVADDDTIVEREGVSLVVDPMSFQYLAGAEVDYQEGLEGSRFVMKNPNASTTCGCGSSFSILSHFAADNKTPQSLTVLRRFLLAGDLLSWGRSRRVHAGLWRR